MCILTVLPSVSIKSVIETLRQDGINSILLSLAPRCCSDRQRTLRETNEVEHQLIICGSFCEHWALGAARGAWRGARLGFISRNDNLRRNNSIVPTAAIFMRVSPRGPALRAHQLIQLYNVVCYSQ